MAKCPSCNHKVRTPFFMNLQGWAEFACPACGSRLEMVPPRAVAWVILIAPLFVLARQGRIYEVIAIAFSLAVILIFVLECVYPKVRLRRKARPEPEIKLNIEGR
jgi:DNA-directed RNA polymerase subunit RPC12/RpoP